MGASRRSGPDRGGLGCGTRAGCANGGPVRDRLRLCVITPCRDEESYAERTINSILRQSRLPDLWIVVDDGSTDNTPAILRTMLADLPWVRIITVDRTGLRQLGSGVVRAFNRGLSSIDLRDFDVVGKLDLDLDLPEGYFEDMMERFALDPRLGSVSGKPYFFDEKGVQRFEVSGDENSVGMVKLYRVKAFEEIGGLVPELMWDGIDCHQLRRHGWQVYSTPSRAVAFEHLRPMGSSDRGVLRGRRRHGAGQYFMGSSAAFVFASALRRAWFPPRIIGSLAMVTGYLSAAVRRAPRFPDVGFRSDLRRFQRESLIMGKRRAIRRWEARVAPGRVPLP